MILMPGPGRADSASGEPRTSAPNAFDPKAAIAHSQAAIGTRLGDYSFLDERGHRVRLADYRGKPLVVSLIYTACTQTCPVVTEHLAAAAEEAWRTLGQDSFSVVTVGFDTQSDKPERLRAYARVHGIDHPGWRFLSGEPQTVEALIQDLGFIRFPSPRGFDHLAQTSIIDPQGRVFRQVYGDTFEAPALVDPLKALVLGDTSGIGGLGDIIQRVRLFCTFYDSRSGRYAFDYSLFISLAIGAASLIAIATVIVRAWLRSKRPPVHPA